MCVCAQMMITHAKLSLGHGAEVHALSTQRPHLNSFSLGGRFSSPIMDSKVSHRVALEMMLLPLQASSWQQACMNSKGNACQQEEKEEVLRYDHAKA